MAITINGTANTVAGLAVGGVPDGSIDRDAVAADLIDGTKIADDAVAAEHVADDAVGVAQLSASGTASSSTFLRGDNAWAAAGGGKIVKFWHTGTGSGEGIGGTTSSSTYAKKGYIDITPTSASNKIHVTVKYNMHFRNHQNNQKSDSFYTKLVRTSAHDDTTSVTDGSTAMGGVWTNNDNGPEYALGMGSLSWMDTPNTTGNLRYALWVKVTDADWTLYLDYATGDSGTTQHDMIAYEIADVATG